jgi:uncharacterized protein
VGNDPDNRDPPSPLGRVNAAASALAATSRTRSPDAERAIAYARARLAAELPATLGYHGLAHTEDDVVPAALRLADGEGVTGRPLELLAVAAWFHDLGYVERYFDNEAVVVALAEDVLPGMGFGAADVATVADVIWATKMPQTPRTRLGEIMADADLDVLGRPDFLRLNTALRAELAGQGRTWADHEWLDGQRRFVAEHRYFTVTARRRNDPGKAMNLAALDRLLAAG